MVCDERRPVLCVEWQCDSDHFGVAGADGLVDARRSIGAVVGGRLAARRGALTGDDEDEADGVGLDGLEVGGPAEDVEGAQDAGCLRALEEARVELLGHGEHDAGALEAGVLEDARVDGVVDVDPELGALLEHGARHGGEVHLEGEAGRGGLRVGACACLGA